jgi:hypothetical protein
LILKSVVVAIVALSASPALAAYDCMILQQCSGGACESYEDALLVKQVGDMWTVSVAGETYEGYETTTMDAGGALSVVLPPQGALSGLVSIYPTGELLFTVHVPADPMAVEITAYGNCAGDGG